ncbi:MAG: Rab family GTPase [Candidatus Njordarchaeales archaeon]
MTSLKVVFIGDSGVGKTSLIRAFMGHDVRSTDTTIGVDFYSFDKGGYKVVIWDFAGQEWFRDVIINFIKGAALVIMVFDLSKPLSLMNLVKNWVNYVVKFSGKHALTIVVGNKSDIKKIDDTVIERSLDAIKEKVNMKLYLQTSALKYENVSRLFDTIFEYTKMINTILRKKKLIEVRA